MSSRTSSWLERLRALQSRYRQQTLATFAVLITLTFIIGQAIPIVDKYLISSNVLTYVIFLVLLDTASYVQRLDATPSVEAIQDQDASMPALLDVASQCKGVNVDLLEYAGLTTLPLIRSLRHVGAHVRILVKHPDTVTGYQRSRTLSTLDTLYTSLFAGYHSSFECRCYRAPYSLRARKFGEQLLELGWLTPDIPRETAFGYNNPVIIVDPRDKKNAHFLTFFARTFNDLWNDSATEDAKEVLLRYESSSTGSTSVGTPPRA